MRLAIAAAAAVALVAGPVAALPAGASAPGVVHAASVPDATSAPRISGSTQVGATVTVSDGTWNGEPTSFSYRWLRNGRPIAGARSRTYVIARDDNGQRLAAQVTATNAEGGATATSPTVRIPYQLVNVKPPKISGTKRVGKKLEVDVGTWNVSRRVRFSIQWLRNGKAIKGATSVTYKLKTKDKGKKVSVRVTARKIPFRDGVAVSKAYTIKKKKK